MSQMDIKYLHYVYI